MDSHIIRYDRMPIPPMEQFTEYFEAGNVRIGVEYRILTDELVAEIRKTLASATGSDVGQLENLDDSGVSLHVFAGPPGKQLEYLRFDCFNEDPHYHYVSWSSSGNEVFHMDPVADGDPLAWSLERISTRLPQMLERAGAPEVAAAVNMGLVDQIMPRVKEKAYRARFAEHAKRKSVA
jgi:hypothetical protein